MSSIVYASDATLAELVDNKAILDATQKLLDISRSLTIPNMRPDKKANLLTKKAEYQLGYIGTVLEVAGYPNVPNEVYMAESVRDGMEEIFGVGRRIPNFQKDEKEGDSKKKKKKSLEEVCLDVYTSVIKVILIEAENAGHKSSIPESGGSGSAKKVHFNLNEHVQFIKSRRGVRADARDEVKKQLDQEEEAARTLAGMQALPGDSVEQADTEEPKKSSKGKDRKRKASPPQETRSDPDGDESMGGCSATKVSAKREAKKTGKRAAGKTSKRSVEKEASPPPEKEASPPPEKEASPPPEKEASPPPEKEASPPPEKEASPIEDKDSDDDVVFVGVSSGPPPKNIVDLTIGN